MADGTGRSEAVGQLLIKAGVPLAVAALAAFFYVRKSSSVQASDEDQHDHIVESTDKENDAVDEARKKVLLGLVDRITELQVKEEELEARFERYQSMKECEGMVLELKSMLLLEMVGGDYLEKEVSWIESEARRMQELEVYGMNLFQQIKNLKQEKRRLKKKMKKYFRKSKEGNRVIEAQELRIRDSEAMIKRSCVEVEKGNYVVTKMAEEIRELQGVVDELRREKTEFLEKLEVAEASLTLKHENEINTIDEYKHIINELEKLQKEFTAEVNEVVQLRWKNACLRRQLMQRDDLDLVAMGSGGEHALLQLDLHHELDRIATERENSTPDETTHRRSLMKKLKKWVKGSHRSTAKASATKANKGDVRSYGRHYSSDWVEEHVHGRKSFSSA